MNNIEQMSLIMANEDDSKSCGEVTKFLGDK